MPTLRFLGMGMVLVTFLLSAMAVIYSKYYSRLIFIETQQQEKTLAQYDVEWGQMQVELAMLLGHNHLETVARNQLKLIMPLREKTIYIEP